MKALWLIPLSSAALLAAPAMKCDALAAKSFGDEVKIHSATLVAAKTNLAEHCDVRGVIWPEAQFAIKLPNGIQLAIDDGFDSTRLPEIVRCLMGVSP